jgi:hypothetical protein
MWAVELVGNRRSIGKVGATEPGESVYVRRHMLRNATPLVLGDEDRWAWPA